MPFHVWPVAPWGQRSGIYCSVAERHAAHVTGGLANGGTCQGVRVGAGVCADTGQEAGRSPTHPLQLVVDPHVIPTWLYLVPGLLVPAGNRAGGVGISWLELSLSSSPWPHSLSYLPWRPAVIHPLLMDDVAVWGHQDKTPWKIGFQRRLSQTRKRWVLISNVSAGQWNCCCDGWQIVLFIHFHSFLVNRGPEKTAGDREAAV